MTKILDLTYPSRRTNFNAFFYESQDLDSGKVGRSRWRSLVQTPIPPVAPPLMPAHHSKTGGTNMIQLRMYEWKCERSEQKIFDGSCWLKLCQDVFH